MTTIAIVDKYGQKFHNQDFLNIIPPRQPKVRDGQEYRMRPGEIADM